MTKENVKAKNLIEALGFVKKQLENNYDYKVLAIYVQGSQNYNCDIYTDTYKSDIDMKAFVLPKPEDIYSNTMVSKKYETLYGQVEVKDFRLFTELVKKANLTYLELLCTEFKLVDERIAEATEGLADRIVIERQIPFLNALRGTANQKYKGIFKATEISQKILDKYGYQPKELHHLYRLFVLTKDVVFAKQKLSESYIPSEEHIKILINIKTGKEFGKDIEYVAEEGARLIKYIDWVINPLLEAKPEIIHKSINNFSKALFNIFMEEIMKY